MLEQALSFLEEFRQSFRIVDAIDMTVVSLFLYSALVWFKQTASRGVLVGVSLLAIVYFLARAFDMYLTSLAFQTTFAVLLFILVVVFQEDLRRMFERLSTWRSLQLPPTHSVAGDVNALVEAVFRMAATRNGALIVLKGLDPLDRQLNSGIPLDGRLSKPLLFSIFDANSPGHDGAAIIDRDLVEQFAAHLPISKNRAEIAGRGTRHSAALGLSECSDALIIAVSEERGIVTVAERGKLTEMSTAADLKDRLEEFFAERFPVNTQSPWTRFLMMHGRLKILAVLLAVIAWFVLAYDPNTIQRTFVVSIEYRNLPDHLVLDESAPDEARVTLSGSERNFRFLDPGSLKISVDVTDARPGFQEIPIVDSSMRLPANVNIYRIEPRIIRLYLRQQQRPPAGQSSEGKTSRMSGGERQDHTEYAKPRAPNPVGSWTVDALAERRSSFGRHPA